MIQLENDGFARRLHEFRLLTPEQWEQLQQQLVDITGDARTLGRELINRGWLTAFQVNQVNRGRSPVLGPYALIRKLGQGSMATVYLAWHRPMRRRVALKVMRRPDLVGRFFREVEILSRLDHPHIVHAYDAAEAGGRPYLVMEFVEGTCLRGLVDKRGPLPVPLACDYVRQAALGLQHAWEHGIVHRDLKPSNLLLKEDKGLIKVADFGLARAHRVSGSSPDLTLSGFVLGTPDYIAPEQVVDPRAADVRSDLYSLGCTLYFLLAGRHPFLGNSAEEKILKHRKEQPDLPPDVPLPVAAVLGRLMAKKPRHRYQSPTDLIEALAPCAA